VVEVKMRVDDDRNVLGTAAGNLKQRIGEWFFAKDAIHRGLFWRPFFAHAGLDQYLFFAGVDE